MPLIKEEKGLIKWDTQIFLKHNYNFINVFINYLWLFWLLNLTYDNLIININGNQDE